MCHTQEIMQVSAKISNAEDLSDSEKRFFLEHINEVGGYLLNQFSGQQSELRGALSCCRSLYQSGFGLLRRIGLFMGGSEPGIFTQMQNRVSELMDRSQMIFVEDKAAIKIPVRANVEVAEIEEVSSAFSRP